MNVEIGAEAALFPEKEYIVSLVWAWPIQMIGEVSWGPKRRVNGRKNW
jgi:hypothetical protein